MAAGMRVTLRPTEGACFVREWHRAEGLPPRTQCNAVVPSRPPSFPPSLRPSSRPTNLPAYLSTSVSLCARASLPRRIYGIPVLPAKPSQQSCCGMSCSSRARVTYRCGAASFYALHDSATHPSYNPSSTVVKHALSTPAAPGSPASALGLNVFHLGGIAARHAVMDPSAIAASH